MKRSVVSALMLSVAVLPVCIGNSSRAVAQELDSFAVIAGQTVTNTGPTTIVGNIAVSPGTAFTGSGSVTQTGAAFLGDAVAIRIQNDLTTAYTYLAALPTSAGGNLTGQDLGGLTLLPGVYNYDSSAILSSGQTLTLDAEGNPDAIFIINIGSTLTVGSGANVNLENGARGGNVFYRVGSSATLDTTADLDGQIIALTSITMNTAATIDCGAALARNGAVTLDTNTINVCAVDGGGFEDVGGEPDGETPDGETPIVDVPRVVIPGNPSNVLTILAEYEANGGVLPLGFAIIAATQTPAQIAVSLTQLTGEVSTGVAPMITQSMDGFIDTLSRPSGAPRLKLAAPRDQGVPIGMVPARDDVYTGKYDTAPAAPTLTYQTVLLPQTKIWNIWMAGYGARSFTEGSNLAGTHDNRTHTTGLAFGLDFLPGANSRIGVAFALDRGDFALSDSYGSGTTKGMFAAVSGSRTFEKGYVQAVLAYGQSDFTTERTVTIAGRDLFSGQATAKNLAAQIEAGYHMGRFTPFVGLRAQRLRIPAYVETTVSGSSTYALSYEEQTSKSLRSELGVAVSLAANENGSLGLRASWAHEFASRTANIAEFQSIPGAAFGVSGAEPDRDSVKFSLRGEYGGGVGVYAGVDLNAEYSGNSQDYGGNLTIGYRW